MEPVPLVMSQQPTYPVFHANPLARSPDK